MNVIQRTIAWFDEYQRRHGFVGFPLAVFKKYGDDEAGHQAALLAYYAFLSIFPLLLVLTSVLKLLVRNNDELRLRIIENATTYFPIVGNELQRNVHGLGTSGIAFIVGLVLALFGARGVADALRGGINHVWQIPYVRRSGFPRALLQSFGSIAIGGAGLMLAPIISGYAVSLGGHGWLARTIALLITVGILYGMFLALVRIALPVRVPLRDLRPAAALAAIGLTTLQIVGGFILTRQLQHLNDLYGTFALVLGLLYWLYLQSQILFYAFEVASVRALKLWPRSIDQQKLTEQDHRAFRLYARRNRYHDDAHVHIRRHRFRRDSD